ncbi:MAG: 2,3,4,5-tetrahydropyridine-2,6-dicarboxylate N-succinyltransferase [Porticoccus sp.]|jgi:2,3,4,5-tetrahydropyridine-2-carboxylate N-succinyltransferase|uniref:2,3,4,5-tetrahydropyridine-2,6-dicarboxylate N-succinyltransferase n=1 Tax=Porticoccus hydrocarbonoclasticus TaxID=1073414 RepID=UPI00055D950E|nr:2,3,4,5-tetrahydropyridine-2,6-dicarboxylate N-succinyltransferase [Porticoccus hydrocarbonoclasticus]MBG57739.1 2,3,4,5-tetrahydropyridine-2,6-dicarboxylate N-succinyltransferase [Porticoccus sp.]|tara:strand:+ start:21360 stop:22391 length:1032 start_codon:yes stop_codon:yes gene_type:complete
MTLYSFGLGIGTQNNNGEWLEVFYPKPLLNPGDTSLTAIKTTLEIQGKNQVMTLTAEQLDTLAAAFATAGEEEQASIARQFQKSSRPVVATVLVSDDAPASVPEGYLKLHLLSHRLVKPNATNLTGLFGVLHNVAWTSEGAIDIGELPARQLQARLAGSPLSVDSVDKFPKMVDYVVPSGVRIADTARVRLGAYIGEGTTIMHEGFVNFNAGTEGTSMVEGRISQGVFVKSGSDLGGGSSTMGTLSGGGNIIITIGNRCLLGANSGLGIPLGDRCTVEAGLYITAGTKVSLLDDQNQLVGQTKARELAGKDDLLFRRNSATGAVECLTNKSAVELNEALHVSN